MLTLENIDGEVAVSRVTLAYNGHGNDREERRLSRGRIGVYDAIGSIEFNSYLSGVLYL